MDEPEAGEGARRATARDRCEDLDAQDPDLQHPLLTREKLPALQEFPASAARFSTLSIALQVGRNLQSQHLKGTIRGTRVSGRAWHSPCPFVVVYYEARRPVRRRPLGCDRASQDG